MIRIETSNPAEARYIIGLLRVTPPGVSYEVTLAGTRVAGRALDAAQPEVTNPREWPPGEVELR